jgi:hypothetical protein
VVLSEKCACGQNFASDQRSTSSGSLGLSSPHLTLSAPLDKESALGQRGHKKGRRFAGGDLVADPLQVHN